jgi:hypothetical protein
LGNGFHYNPIEPGFKNLLKIFILTKHLYFNIPT